LGFTNERPLLIIVPTITTLLSMCWWWCWQLRPF